MVLGDVPDELAERVAASLRDAGARFAFLHGSRVAGTHRSDSDVDVAAWWGEGAPPSFEVSLDIYFDELPRIERARRDFLEAFSRGR